MALKATMRFPYEYGSMKQDGTSPFNLNFLLIQLPNITGSTSRQRLLVYPFTTVQLKAIWYVVSTVIINYYHEVKGKTASMILITSVERN